MNINYDYYRIFYFVAKYGNISQAAKLLLNNQPNLTRTIKNLESELGCPLFSRTNRGMRLTPEGQKLYEHIKVAIEHIEAGEEEITEAIAALKDGTADIAIVTTPTVRSASLSETPLRSVREVAICSPAFKELLGRKISLADLGNYPLISLGTSTKSFEFYSAFFTEHGLPYSPDIEAATADQILPMAQADLGVGFVPEEFVNPSDKVQIIDLEEEIPERSICLIKRKEQPLSVAAKELERMIIELASGE